MVALSKPDEVKRGFDDWEVSRTKQQALRGDYSDVLQRGARDDEKIRYSSLKRESDDVLLRTSHPSPPESFEARSQRDGEIRRTQSADIVQGPVYKQDPHERPDSAFPDAYTTFKEPHALVYELKNPLALFDEIRKDKAMKGSGFYYHWPIPVELLEMCMIPEHPTMPEGVVPLDQKDRLIKHDTQHPSDFFTLEAAYINQRLTKFRKIKDKHQKGTDLLKEERGYFIPRAIPYEDNVALYSAQELSERLYREKVEIPFGTKKMMRLIKGHPLSSKEEHFLYEKFLEDFQNYSFLILMKYLSLKLLVVQLG